MKFRNVLLVFIIINISILYGCENRLSISKSSDPSSVISNYIDGYLASDYEKIVPVDYTAWQSVNSAIKDAPSSMQNEVIQKKVSELVKKFQETEKNKERIRTYMQPDVMGGSLFSILYPNVQYSVLETKNTSETERMMKGGSTKFSLVKLTYSSQENAPFNRHLKTVKEGIFKVYLKSIETKKGQIKYKVYGCLLTDFGQIPF